MARSQPQVSRRRALIRISTAAGAFLARRLKGNKQTSLSIAGLPIDLRLSALSRMTLRITFLNPPVAAVLKELNDDPVLELRSDGGRLLSEQTTSFSRVLAWGHRRVRVSRAPLTIVIEDENGKPIQAFRIDNDGTVTFRSSFGPVFGLGEGGPQFDRRGQLYTMQNGQVGPLLSTVGARLPIPWLVSADGWGVFFHQPFGVINLSGQDYTFEQPAIAVENAVPLDIFFVASREPKEILRAYAEITGFPHMPPLWAFGYQQSHRTLTSPEEVLDEAKKFRADQLPCDTMIYLGTGFCPSGWNTGHGSFVFNKKIFPNPKRVIEELHDENFHVVLHVTKPPKHLHGRVSDTGAAAQDISDAAFDWARHLDVFRLGVDGWWPDEGDPLAPEARLTRNRMYWEGPIKERPNERPFALHRNGYAGLQRYGWLWSGDVDSTWETLRKQISVGLNVGLSGVPYWGTDTGGHIVTSELTGELYVRWFQFSTFCPLFRSHGVTWKLRLPWGWNTGEYGPVELYGPQSSLPPPQALHDPRVEPICRKYLNLRYSLLPYLYTAVREAHDTGLPIMRALWLHYPNDHRAVERDDEYLWGGDILVAPVTNPGASSRRLYLPHGVWYDFWTEERIQGGQEIVRSVDLSTLPIYVREGSVLPVGPVKQHTTATARERLRLMIYPGLDSRTEIYEDDGLTFGFSHGNFARTRITWEERNHHLVISRAGGSWNSTAVAREFGVRVVPKHAEQTANFSGDAITLQL